MSDQEHVMVDLTEIFAHTRPHMFRETHREIFHEDKPFLKCRWSKDLLPLSLVADVFSVGVVHILMSV